MSQIIDLFRGAAGALLAAHTPTEGGPWAIPGGRAPVLDGAGVNQWVNTGGITIPGPAGDPVVQALTPDAIAGDLSLVFEYQDLGGAGTQEDSLGMLARYQDATHWYSLNWKASEGGIVIVKQNGASQEQPLESFPAVDLAAGAPFVWQISGATHAVFFPDGTSATWTDTDGPFTDPGKAGIAGSGAGNSTPTTGCHLRQAVATSGLLYPMP